MNITQEQQNTGWKVEFSSRAKKQKATLPEKIDDVLSMLVMEIKKKVPHSRNGKTMANWAARKMSITAT